MSMKKKIGEHETINKLMQLQNSVRLFRLHWFEHMQRTEGNNIPKRVLYMYLETKRLKGNPRNGWKD
jgi:hypothetical protein